MSTLEQYLKKQLENEEFRKEYYKQRFFDEIGVQIIKLRMKFNLSQAALAEKAGTTQAVISRIENGSVSATVGTIQKIAEAMDSVVKIEFIPNNEMRHLEIYSDLFLSFSEKNTEEQENLKDFSVVLPKNNEESCRMVPLSDSYLLTETNTRVFA